MDPYHSFPVRPPQDMSLGSLLDNVSILRLMEDIHWYRMLRAFIEPTDFDAANRIADYTFTISNLMRRLESRTSHPSYSLATNLDNMDYLDPSTALKALYNLDSAPRDRHLLKKGHSDATFGKDSQTILQDLVKRNPMLVDPIDEDFAADRNLLSSNSTGAEAVLYEKYRARAGGSPVHVGELNILRAVLYYSRRLYIQKNGLVSLRILKYMAKETTHNHTSLLFRLPPELRQVIWKDVLTINGKIKADYIPKRTKVVGSYRTTRAWIGAAKNNFHRQRDFEPHTFALPLVCRAIYAETATMLYTHNTFAFHTRKALGQWIRDRLPAQVEAVRKLQLDHHLPGHFHLLEIFPNLRVVDLTICYQCVPGNWQHISHSREWLPRLVEEMIEREGKNKNGNLLKVKFLPEGERL